MQRVRFSSPDAYEKFKVVFADTRHHLMELPGFIHLTWWEHPDDAGWFNEVSFWASKEALRDWHMKTYHKYAKAWAANGAPSSRPALPSSRTSSPRRISTSWPVPMAWSSRP
jgi:heme-degrading monooxygenase HmoA